MIKQHQISLNVFFVEPCVRRKKDILAFLGIRVKAGRPVENMIIYLLPTHWCSYNRPYWNWGCTDDHTTLQNKILVTQIFLVFR